MKATKPITISSISMEEFEYIYNEPRHKLNWNCLFVLPFWLKNWFPEFGGGKQEMILALRSESSVLGIAPLMQAGNTARFMGSESVCDYQDMIMADTCHDAFFSHLLDYLKQKGVKRLELGALRPDSMALKGFSSMPGQRVYDSTCRVVDRFYELKLPKTWDGYLKLLDGKQRHEVRRKIRRLNEAGQVRYHVVDNRDAVDDAFDEFLLLFKASRKDKARFLTDRMQAFFRNLAKTMAKRDMLQLGFLKINGTNAAATFCFEYDNQVFLYNNGYLPKFRPLSAGALGKIFSIRHSIEKNMTRYDFLKGKEVYKQRLGGRPVPLYRLSINL